MIDPNVRGVGLRSFTSQITIKRRSYYHLIRTLLAPKSIRFLGVKSLNPV
jgi:hypothetical protein